MNSKEIKIKEMDDAFNALLEAFKMVPPILWYYWRNNEAIMYEEILEYIGSSYSNLREDYLNDIADADEVNKYINIALELSEMVKDRLGMAVDLAMDERIRDLVIERMWNNLECDYCHNKYASFRNDINKTLCANCYWRETV